MKILLGLKPIIHEKKWNGLNLHVFHTTGLESAGIGVFKAVLDIIKEYQGLIIVTPRILNPKEYFLNAQEWY